MLFLVFIYRFSITLTLINFLFYVGALIALIWTWPNLKSLSLVFSSIGPLLTLSRLSHFETYLYVYFHLSIFVFQLFQFNIDAVKFYHCHEKTLSRLFLFAFSLKFHNNFETWNFTTIRKDRNIFLKHVDYLWHSQNDDLTFRAALNFLIASWIGIVYIF